MADDHMDIIPASENEDSNIEPFPQLLALNHDSENSEDINYSKPSPNELLEIVNEHNEVLGVVQLSDFGQREEQAGNLAEDDTNLNIDQHDRNNDDPTPQDEIQDYEPPPFPEDMFSNSESNSDTPDYYLESSGEDEPAIPQVRVPLKNHARDVEHPDDFAHDWLWIEEDTGPSYGSFTGNPGLNIQPTQRDPLGYFNLFFEPSMNTTLATETNSYARQRIQSVTGYILHDKYTIFTQ